MPKAINYKLLLYYLPLGSLIFLFIYLGFFGVASSDDYADYMQVEKFGYLNTVKETYLHWGGRFTSYILVYPINPLNFGEQIGPQIFNFIQICMFALLSFLFSKYIIRKSIAKVEFCLFFSLLAFLLFCYLPKPVELLYWFTGSWVYLPGLIGICYWLLLLENITLNRFQKITFLVLPFLIAGTNELNLLIEGWLITIFLILRKPTKLYWIAIVLFVLGASIALLTPGNFKRSDFFLLQAHHPARDFIFSFINSFKLSIHYLKDWFRSSPILLIWLAFAFLLPYKKIEINYKLILVLVLTTLMIPLIFFPFVYGTGMITPPERLLNVLYIFIVLSGSAIFPQLISNYVVKSKLSNKVACSIGIIIIFQASYASRLRTVFFDLKELSDYKIETEYRIKLANNHSLNSPNDTLVLPIIKHIPYTIFYSDLNPNAGHWYNQGFAYYHNIKAVKVIDNE
jgi:hypothetical protein